MRVLGHGAANVTLGIPRLREIVMTASRQPKTPSMTMTIAKGISEDQADAFARRASRLTLSQVIERVTVEERLTVNNQARRKEFTIDIEFYPEREYRAEFDVSPMELVHAFGNRFPLTLKREILLEIKRLATELKRQADEIGKGSTIPQGEGSSSAVGQAEEDVDADTGEPAPRKDDDEESEGGDGDASMEKRQRQKQQQTSYESEEDEDTDDIEPPDAEMETTSDLEAEVPVNEELEKKHRKKTKLKEVVSQVKQAFYENMPQATSFDFNPSRCNIILEVSRTCSALYRIGVDSK